VTFTEFPDPEALIVAYLTEQLPAYDVTLPVATTIPLDTDGAPADRYVRVVLTGGSARDLVIDDALFAIENHDGIDGDSAETARIAGIIRGLMSAMPLHVPAVRRVREVGRPVPRHHPDTGAPSYSQTLQITTRGH